MLLGDANDNVYTVGSIKNEFEPRYWSSIYEGCE
jgi:hypothetical protein